MHIDALIPWVDCNDPVWYEKFSRFKAAEQGRGYFTRATSSTRFQDVGELSRCLRSIEKHAPWFRNIFVLADDQIPRIDSLSQETADKIKIVTHRDIFGPSSQHLPTFNSASITCMIWNLEPLSEQFVYFNDDHFISRAVTPESFFDSGSIILRGKWSPMMRPLSSRLRRAIVGRNERSTGFTDSQRKAAEMLNFRNTFFKFDHAPKAVLKSEMKAVFEEFRRPVEESMSFRFRHPDQFSFMALYFHATISKGNARFADVSSTVSVKGSRRFEREMSRLRRALEDPNVQFLCLQGLDRFTERQVEMVMRELDSHLGTGTCR